MKQITSIPELQSLLSEVANGYIVAKFYADWCGPCKMMDPIFDNVVADEAVVASGVHFVKINRDENRDLMAEFNIEFPTIPRFIAMKVVNGSLDSWEDFGGSQSKTQLVEKILALNMTSTESSQNEATAEQEGPLSIAILGTGPSGLTAALYAARAGFDVTMYAGPQPGGQLTTTTDIENFPGAWDTEKKKGMNGFDLVQLIQNQAEHFGAKVEFGEATDMRQTTIEGKPAVELTINDSEKKTFHSVIIASGATARYLGIEGEEAYVGKGYHTCATCDGAFYKDKIVALVGGGDSAMEEAMFVARFASKVYLIHRRDEFRASPIMLKRAQENVSIEFVTHAQITELHGEDGLTHVTVENTKDTVNPLLDDNAVFEKQDNGKYKLVLDGLFVAIGHDPATKFTGNLLDKDGAGYLIPQGRIPQEMRTSKYAMATKIPGVFVAGDVEDNVYRQAITAAGDGCKAALDCQRWLEDIHE